MYRFAMAVAMAVLLSMSGHHVADAADAKLTVETFRSPKVTLKSGQIANTPSDFGPLEWIKGAAVIRHFASRLVDGTGRHVPLTEVYVHHWLIFDISNGSVGSASGGYCANLENTFGIGAELVHTVYDYAAPYGVVVHGRERWTANLHFIRTSNVEQHNVQDCIECRCPDSAPPQRPDGGVACCPDRGQCWSMHNSTLNDPVDYYLEYDIGYVRLDGVGADGDEPRVGGRSDAATTMTTTPTAPPTAGGAPVLPLTVFSLDATSTHTTDCQIEHQIAGPLAPGQTSVLTSTSEIDTDMDVVYMNVHQHVGGVNLTVTHVRDGKDVGVMCVATPTYGTGNATDAGNEGGYVVGIKPCRWAVPSSSLSSSSSLQKPYALKAGDQLRLTSIYGGRHIPGGHRYHAGVMSLVFFAAHTKVTSIEQCRAAMAHKCGVAPYSSTRACLSCAQRHGQYLQLHGCNPSVGVAQQMCARSLDGGNIPAPLSVNNMHVVATPLPASSSSSSSSSPQQASFNLQVTAPFTNWIGVGFNADKAAMANATAYVFVQRPSQSQSHPRHARRMSKKSSSSSSSSSSSAAPPPPPPPRSEWMLQHRRLGNHNPGVSLQDDYPCNWSVVDGVAHLSYNVTVDLRTSEGRGMVRQLLRLRQEVNDDNEDDDATPKPGPASANTRECVLMAQGQPGAFTLQYHGSTRGWMCLAA